MFSAKAKSTLLFIVKRNKYIHNAEKNESQLFNSDHIGWRIARG
jgi:hypothetical protein